MNLRSPHFDDHSLTVWVAVTMAICAAAFGAWGLWIYESNLGHHPDPFAVGYHTLQLFAFHSPHLELPIPWQLHLGRWLAALILLGAVVHGIATFFHCECRLLYIRARRGHIVVCGLGRLGMRLAKEFRNAGWRVIAIETIPTTGQIAMAHNAGLAVITGDASDPNVLKKAAIANASRIITVCDDEQKNVSIAIAAGKLMSGASRLETSPLECWLFIADRRLREIFKKNDLFPYQSGNYLVNVRGLDPFELSARRALKEFPLDYELIKPSSPLSVHFAIIGFGSMGKHLALQAALIGHYANGTKLRITLLDPDATSRRESFLHMFPQFPDVCDFHTIDIPSDCMDPDAILDHLPAPSDTELLSVAVCWESRSTASPGLSDAWEQLAVDDPANLHLAINLSQRRTDLRILVFQSRQTGYGSFLSMEHRGAALTHNLRPFGMIETALSADELLNESEDAIARALHQVYLETQLAAGRKIGDGPAVFEWAHLTEFYRDSNRRAADHIWVKARALGCTIEKGGPMPRRVSSFADDQIELLGKMEHSSWNAEKCLANFTYGPRKDSARQHHLLVPWDQLEPKDKAWDFAQVKAIPKALQKVGLSIYTQA